MTKFLPFLLQHLRHSRVRTLTTALALALCVFLFCVLQSVLAQFDQMISSRNPRRLITRNGIGVVSSLPMAYADRIRTVPGVTQVAASLVFGGFLPGRREARDEDAGVEWTSAFSNIAVDAEAYFSMTPEYVMPRDGFQAFLGDLRGCVIGRQLADKFGFRVGDRIHLESFVDTLRKPSGPFEFVVHAIYDADPRHPGTDTNTMFFHFRYLHESLGWARHGAAHTHLFVVGIDDPARSAEIAAAIDALFENAGEQTFTETERAFLTSFMNMVGDLSVVVNGIGLAVCFTILLVTANTMSMAVRERRTEIAVLKTVGFTSAQVMGLVVAEALLLAALSGGVGVAGAKGALWLLTETPRLTLAGLTQVTLRSQVALSGVAVALLLGFAAGFFPAWGAYRARVTEMLRHL